MRVHRVFISKPLEAGGEITLRGNPAHYLSRVLRLSDGAEVVLFNGDGHDYRCRLGDFDREQVNAQVLEQKPNRAESPLKITLAQAISRGERMDYTLQKATELGVAAVQLLNSERVEVKLEGRRLEKRLAHWRGVMTSASEQSGRAVVPELRSPISLMEWADRPGTRLVLDAHAGQSLGHITPASSVEIAVGPEGGFTQAELKSMEQAGVSGIHLGPRVLRTETAGPAAIAVLQSKLGDMG